MIDSSIRMPLESIRDPKGQALFKAAGCIIGRVEEAGHRAVVVGGFVRDLLLGRTVVDIDVATNMPLSRLKGLFPKLLEVGKSFGVVIVRQDGVPVTVAQFRAEADYVDGRHPDRVTFIDDFQTDALRRDFTINALALDREGRLIDPVGGLSDLQAGVIRAIGNPRERFAEDALRLLRAVRFSAQLGFRIEPQTAVAIRELASQIARISGERIKAELDKILLAPRGGTGIQQLQELDLLQPILPEVDALVGVAQSPDYHPEGDVFQHTVAALDALAPEADLCTAWGLLLHDIGKPGAVRFHQEQGRLAFYRHEEIGAQMVEEIARRFRFTNEERKVVQWLVRQHLRIARLLEMRPAKAQLLMAEEGFERLLQLYQADVLATGGSPQAIFSFVRQHRRQASRAVHRPPLINGHDLINLGYPPGPLFAEILTQVRDLTLEGGLHNREEAIAYVFQRFPLASTAGTPGKVQDR